MADLSTFYPVCDVCGEVISLRDGQELGNLAITREDVPDGYGLNQVRKGFARSSTYGDPEAPESQVCAAVGEKAEANWHGDQEACTPTNLIQEPDDV